MADIWLMVECSNVIPTDVVKDMGADIIIGVDLEGLFPFG